MYVEALLLEWRFLCFTVEEPLARRHSVLYKQSAPRHQTQHGIVTEKGIFANLSKLQLTNVPRMNTNRGKPVPTGSSTRIKLTCQASPQYRGYKAVHPQKEPPWTEVAGSNRRP